MCLILFARQQHPVYSLVMLANRDEFFQRPTQFAQYWTDAPHILGGRDLDHYGSWLAVDRQGRFAAVTNYRDVSEKKPSALSRGKLISNYLQGNAAAKDYANELLGVRHQYAGFNLLVGDKHSLYFLSSRVSRPEELAAGVYALSNAELDSPWPKAEIGKSVLQQQLTSSGFPDKERLFALLADQRQAEDSTLPDTGISLEWERKLSAIFVRAGDYGTRASTIMSISKEGELDFTERNFDIGGKQINTQHYQFQIEANIQ